MEFYYKHPTTDKIKKVKRGYSWTTLFFGLLVPLCRLDWKWFGIELGCVILISIIIELLNINISCISIPIWAIWANYYNEYYEKDLIKKGYVLQSL